jgi:hypothetical protein
VTGDEGVAPRATEETVAGRGSSSMEGFRRSPNPAVAAAVALLGLWLISSPVTFGYTSHAMWWSDILSGLTLVVLPFLLFTPTVSEHSRWAIAVVGLWLQLAPLLFWAPEAAAYVNNTMVGALAIAIAIVLRDLPGTADDVASYASHIPEGWSYNPSSWLQRLPLIVLAFLGWLVSRYLAAFQLGYITNAWDPFFGEGTANVLMSEVSHRFPLPDAGLGATVYTLEFLLACSGDRARWRTMPWMVFLFFLLVVPLGIAHVVLVTLQPVVVGAWCTLCLVAAGLMLLMIPLAADEIVAAGQHVAAEVRRQRPVWQVVLGRRIDQRDPGERREQLSSGTMTDGVSVTWTLAACTAAGVWIMASPGILGMQTMAANFNYVAGALAITVSVTSMAEVLRPARFFNVALGVAVAAAPWLLAGATPAGRWSNLLAGACLVVFSLRRGELRERYGNWNHWIF